MTIYIKEMKSSVKNFKKYIAYKTAKMDLNDIVIAVLFRLLTEKI